VKRLLKRERLWLKSIRKSLRKKKRKKKDTTSTEKENQSNDKSGSPQSKVLYGGRVQKIVSYTAGLASVAFLSHIKAETYDPNTEQKLIDILSKSHAYFDSRVFSVPNNAEILNNVLWRHKFDYRRNSISSLARHHFSTKELHGLHGGEQLAKMLEKGVDWHTHPGWYKWGSFIKKQLYKVELPNPKTGEQIVAIRTKIVKKSFAMDQFSSEHIYFLLSRYFDENEKDVETVNF